MGQFTNQLRAFNEKTTRNANKVLALSSFVVFSRVITRSPVDTGRFRGNWQIGVGSAPADELEATDKTGGPTISNGENVALSARLGQDVFIVNNLPYASRLETGYSQQAPAGMVAVTVAEWPGIVADATDVVK